VAASRGRFPLPSPARLGSRDLRVLTATWSFSHRPAIWWP